MVRAGGWQCPTRDCRNNTEWVFARNSHCPLCSVAGPPKTDAERAEASELSNAIKDLS